MGICVGLQALFEGSAEDQDVPGLGFVQERLERFNDERKSVPHIGWNSARITDESGIADNQSLYGIQKNSKYYYVHSYMAPYRSGHLEKAGWKVAVADYEGETFVGAITKDNVLATQFHPEKSGAAGLRVLKAFLDGKRLTPYGEESGKVIKASSGLTSRIIACLDVRTNDQGDLVVTKGDQYDVREKSSGSDVRNLGKPVELAEKYYRQGADEVVFLNITSFRDTPVKDQPMLEILRKTSSTVFVPLTVGGGIRDTHDPETGKTVPALDVATLYFKSGADKVSLGTDAVVAAQEYYANNCIPTGNTAIETISKAYGNQAVVVSVDPKRVYVTDPLASKHYTMPTKFPGPNGEGHCWYACTIHGGRTTTDLDVVQLVTCVAKLGAGEILLNCIDRDGTNSGFDLELIRQVKSTVKIPIIASSGAGNADHFKQVFSETNVDAALGAGIFHRGEWTVEQVKDELIRDGLSIRNFEQEDF